MKIQRTPWLERDVMDFEDVYMNLGITKEETTLMGEDKESLSDYKELFVENPESSAGGRRSRNREEHVSC